MEAQNEKKYVSHLGYDYTKYVKTEQDVKDFEQLCKHEEASHRPLKESVYDVVAALNLDRKLRGFAQNVSIQAGPKYN